jgi:hypothetical protein
MQRLTIIKLIHTIIWVFYNILIAYLFFAVTTDRINKWVWISLGMIGVEIIVLLIFHMNCPLTLVARKYSASTRNNFDIFLPEWLAKNNKLIYSVLLVVILLLLVYRLTF